MNGNQHVEQIQPRRVVVDNISALTTGGAETLAIRMDTVSETGITYVGKALPGTGTATALWQIQKID